MFKKETNINKWSISPSQGGFTLIELMVATSIFVIIMLSSMSSLFILLDAAKSSRALRFAMDNVNFTMESMTRSIRMGTDYYCVIAGDAINMGTLVGGNNCLDGGTFLAFFPQESSTRIGYRLNNYTVEKCNSTGCVPIISEGVKIEKLKFFVKGSEADDKTQASVYIIMKGTVTVKGVDTSFAVQTIASQRNF
jgi:prepilin-type N-terminal cleavage/methylation domain-containing protein